MRRIATLCLPALLIGAFAAGSVLAKNVTLKDPTGDDNGPGNYVYPTDAVYTQGSFDLTQLQVQDGNNVNFEVTFNAKLEDPWRMGNGFSTQMAIVFIDTGEGGSTQTLPGLNVQFADDSAWDYAVILSPQPASRVRAEVDTKVAGDMKARVLVPERVRGGNRSIAGSIPRASLPEGDPAEWGYQVVVQSNEGYPASTDLLTRKVNEYEGQHRFGGGTDTDCDPHVMDVLAGNGKGDRDEIEAQHQMLQYECAGDGTASKMATLTMVRAED